MYLEQVPNLGLLLLRQADRYSPASAPPTRRSSLSFQSTLKMRGEGVCRAASLRKPCLDTPNLSERQRARRAGWLERRKLFEPKPGGPRR